MDMRNFINLVEDANHLSPILVVVHPGSACGSADFNIGEHAARIERDGLASAIGAWKGAVIVLSGAFDSELNKPQYAHLGRAIKSALEHAKASGLIAISQRAHDPAQVRVIKAILTKLKLPDHTPFEVTGAWTGHDEKGCVDSVYEAITAMGYHRVQIAEHAVHIDSKHDTRESFEGSDHVLNEMPQLGADEDFDFNNPQINRLEYERLLHQHYETIREDNGQLLGHIQEHEEGEFFLLDVKAKALIFSVQYDLEQTKTFGTVAIQRVLWRKQGTGHGVPQMVFNLLLEKFGSVMTDHSQTDAGRAFWMKRMVEAHAKGLTVAAIDDEGVHIFDGKTDITQWITQQDAWGEHHSYKAIGFVISKKSN